VRSVGNGSVQSQASYRRSLRYAEAIAGGVEPLASRLHVSPVKLLSWSAGWEKIPDSAFLAAVDVICGASEDELNRARGYHPSDGQPGRE
jgi:hypothetical protein